MPRLYHTKSKTGCARCRARRVKCDEVKPTCGGCARHNVECIYDRESQGSQASGGGPPNATDSPVDSRAQSVHSLPSPGFSSPVTPETRDRRLRELYLFHLYTVEVCRTLPGTYQSENLKAWMIDVPRVALEHETLHNTIMAVSLHWMMHTGHKPASNLAFDDLSSLRASYLETVLQEHSRELTKLGQLTADAASFTAVLLSVDAFASLRGRSSQMIPYRPPTEWFHMCKGVHMVVTSALSMTSQLSSLKIGELAANTASYWEPSAIYNETNRSKFPYLLEHREGEEENSEETDTYTMAISHIGAIMSAHESGEPFGKMVRRILIFPILVPRIFVESAGKLRPRALVILAHYFALVTLCSELWWIGDSPAREVRSIYDNIGTGWKDLMRWPMELITETSAKTPAQSVS